MGKLDRGRVVRRDPVGCQVDAQAAVVAEGLKERIRKGDARGARVVRIAAGLGFGPLEVAAAGGHAMLLTGPPGSGCCFATHYSGGGLPE